MGKSIGAVDVDAWDGAPEVAPPPRQGARVHHLSGAELREDGVEEAVRQVAQPVPAVGGGAISGHPGLREGTLVDHGRTKEMDIISQKKEKEIALHVWVLIFSL